mgnify:CR=1 FL=1
MYAVIPTAGEGIRMRPLTLTRHKSLLEISGKPILEHIIDNLPPEADKVILIVGYLGEHIKDYFGNVFKDREISYVMQKEKLGTANAIWLCRDILQGERFLMMYGDDIIDKESIASLMKHDLALLTKEVVDPRRFGVVMADRHGKVLDVIEKPESPISNLALTGVKILDSRIFEYPASRHSNGEYYITDSVAKMAKVHDVFVERAKTWISIATPEDLARAEKELCELQNLAKIQ